MGPQEGHQGPQVGHQWPQVGHLRPQGYHMSSGITLISLGLQWGHFKPHNIEPQGSNFGPQKGSIGFQGSHIWPQVGHFGLQVGHFWPQGSHLGLQRDSKQSVWGFYRAYIVAVHDKDGVSFSKIYFCFSNAIAPMFLNRFLKVNSKKVLRDSIDLIPIGFVLIKLSIFDEF